MIKYSIQTHLSCFISPLDRYFDASKYKKKIHFKTQQNFSIASLGDQNKAMQIKMFEQSDVALRSTIEQFIQEKYQHIHHASIEHFSSILFAGYSQTGLQVAIGMEKLTQKKAFLEQYLDIPIEQALNKISRSTITRDKIAEIGNLAAKNIEQAKLMVAFLVFYLSKQQIKWAVCTGITAVRYVLQQMGLRFYVLEKANPDALGIKKHLWGSYYQQKPYVLAICVEEALQVAQKQYQFFDTAPVFE